MIDNLYNTDILTLAAGLKNERLDAPHGSARKVSKLCGSWLEIDVNMAGGAEGNSTVTECALRLQACALGQASAAILKDNIIGASYGEVKAARDGLYAMLKDGAAAPEGRFKNLKLLAGVKDYPARHTSTMLAFDAALAAIKSAQYCAATNSPPLSGPAAQ